MNNPTHNIQITSHKRGKGLDQAKQGGGPENLYTKTQD
jgi:hypothetical protein